MIQRSHRVIGFLWRNAILGGVGAFALLLMIPLSGCTGRRAPGLHRWINISSALGNEFIALEPIGPALWQLYFGPTTLGWFDEELFVIFDTHGNTGRNPIC